MKQWTMILMVLVLTSCMNNEARKHDMEIEVVESASYDFVEDDKNFDELALTNDKLQEYYELNLLKQLHPEFGEDIQQQLEQFGSKHIDLPKTAKNISITDLTRKSSEKLNDSVVRLTLEFNIKTEVSRTKDSIAAYITSKELIIDGETTLSKKIKFKGLR